MPLLARGNPPVDEADRLDRAIARGASLVSVYRRLDRSAQIAFVIVVVLVSVAVFAPMVAPHDPSEPHYDHSLEEPSTTFPLGTDLTGRDIFSRLLFGARVSLAVGVVAVSMAIAIGVPIGSIAGYLGGWVDEGLMRLMDVLIAFPALVLALALVGALGPSLQNIILIIGVVYSPQYARLIRGSVLSVKEETYVEAARTTGVSHPTILFKHVVPNALGPVLVQATFHTATAILFEAALSYLGLGLQPPTPTWGVMIADGRSYLPDQWWISTFPGVAIMVTVLSFNLLGDGLRDEFDPRSATRGGPEA